MATPPWLNAPAAPAIASAGGVPPPSPTVPHTEVPPAPLKKPSPIFSALVLAGAAMLLVALLLPWSAVALSASEGSYYINATFDFDAFQLCSSLSEHLPPHTNGTNGTGGGNGSGNLLGSPGCLSYSALIQQANGSQGSGGLEILVLVLLLGAVLVVLGAVLGIAGAALGLRPPPPSATRKSLKRPYSLSRNGAVLALVGGLILLVLFTIIIGFLVGGACGSGGSGSSSSGSSGLSFQLMGSCTPSFSSGNSGGSGGGGGMSNVTAHLSWGPGYATYLDFAGFAVMLAGSLGMRGYWKRMSSTVSDGESPEDEVARLERELAAARERLARARAVAPPPGPLRPSGPGSSATPPPFWPPGPTPPPDPTSSQRAPDPQADPSFCESCGEPMGASQTFCKRCGARVSC